MKEAIGYFVAYIFATWFVLPLCIAFIGWSTGDRVLPYMTAVKQSNIVISSALLLILIFALFVKALEWCFS